MRGETQFKGHFECRKKDKFFHAAAAAKKFIATGHPGPIVPSGGTQHASFRSNQSEKCQNDHI